MFACCTARIFMCVHVDVVQGLLFAVLFLPGLEDCVVGASSFGDSFFFSIQTLSTSVRLFFVLANVCSLASLVGACLVMLVCRSIGYGGLSPMCLRADVLVTVEVRVTPRTQTSLGHETSADAASSSHERTFVLLWRFALCSFSKLMWVLVCE